MNIDDLHNSRIKLRMTLFDIYSEMNSIMQQNPSLSSGERSIRVSVRRIKPLLDKLNVQFDEMCKVINSVDEDF